MEQEIYLIAYTDSEGNCFENHPWIHQGDVGDKESNLRFAKHIVNDLGYQKAIVFKSDVNTLSEMEEITWGFANDNMVAVYYNS